MRWRRRHSRLFLESRPVLRRFWILGKKVKSRSEIMKIIKSLDHFSNSKSLWTFSNVTLRFFLCTMTFYIGLRATFFHEFSFFGQLFEQPWLIQNNFLQTGGELLPPRVRYFPPDGLLPRGRPAEVDPLSGLDGGRKSTQQRPARLVSAGYD